MDNPSVCFCRLGIKLKFFGVTGKWEKPKVERGFAVAKIENTTIKRYCDVDGCSIVDSVKYLDARDAINDMIETMDKEGIDRSDIAATLLRLVSEGTFTLAFLKSRQ